MSDNAKYYYLRLKENFFESDSMILLESMADGYLYSNILLKLYLRSLQYGGRLMLNNCIPFNPQMLASVTRHQVGTVEKALNIFKQLGLIEVMDSGAIYVLDIQNYIGKSSTEAERKKDYRIKIEQEKGKLLRQKSDKCPDKYPPEIEIEKEIELELKKEIDTEEKPASIPKADIEFLVEQYNKGLGGILPVVKKITSERIKKAKAILKDFTVDEITLAIQKTAESNFLKGETENSNWKASWDWIMNKTNLTKILEGNYDNTGNTLVFKGNKKMSVAEKLDAVERRAEERGITNIWG